MRNLTYIVIAIAAVLVVGLAALQFTGSDEEAPAPVAATAETGEAPAATAAPAADEANGDAAYANEALAEITADDKVLGDKDAPVTIIEYSSMTCPHCAHFHTDVLPKIKEQYIDTGKVKLALRDFPLNQPAMVAAQIAHCVPDNRYYGFVDVVFETQAAWAMSEDPAAALSQTARLAGLSAGQVEACLADEALGERILQTRLDGSKAFDISSTPTFIINGEKVLGAQDFEVFQKVIEKHLP